MADDPIAVFREWHRAAAGSGAAIRSNTMCLSTVDEAGFPQARFVELKAVRSDGFVFCTSHASPKGRQIDANPQVALTFWWENVGVQVRVLGPARRIDPTEADSLVAARGREARLASWAFEQSAPLAPGESTADRMEPVRRRFEDTEISRPPHWGGYLVSPQRVEFLRFNDSRVHERLVFDLVNGVWLRSRLQP